MPFRAMKYSYGTDQYVKKKKGKEKKKKVGEENLPDRNSPLIFISFSPYSFLLSWFTTRNEQTTSTAPIQYMALEYWPCRKIWATRDRGIVKLRPTVTTNGVVRSIAYAQQISEASEVAELI